MGHGSKVFYAVDILQFAKTVTWSCLTRVSTAGLIAPVGKKHKKTTKLIAKKLKKETNVVVVVIVITER